ncbi:MAG: hypothetical protein ACYCOR_11300 [Acidobacteriaceae bacterium]
MLNPTSNRRRFDIAAARQWLAVGAPVADVMTMLEVRHRFDLSSADCRVYAVEILRATQQAIRAPKPTLSPQRKEAHHALA